MINYIKNTFIIIICGIVTFFCLRFPEDVGTGVSEAIKRCLYIIIPSMFIFMCLTSYMAKSGIYKIIGIPFKFISEKLFRLPPEGFAVFLLSMVSGYPAGIKLVSDCKANNDISDSTALLMNCFCFSSGPAFITGTVSAVLYPDTNSGLIIFLSVLSGNIFCAIFSGLLSEKISHSHSKKIVIKNNCLIDSVKSSASAIMQMSVMITAFGGFCSILKLSGFINFISSYAHDFFDIDRNTAESVIMTFLEISNITSMPKMEISLMPIISALLSFGGICVILQIIAISDENFSVKSFLAARLAASLASAAVCRILLRFSDMPPIETVSYHYTSEGKFSPLPTIFLFIMVIMLLSLFCNNNKKTDRKFSAR